jgi:hypothetical protein
VKFHPPQTDIDNDRTQAEKEYIENYAGRIGDVRLPPLAGHAVNCVWPVRATPQPGPRQQNSRQRDQEI